MTRWKYPADLMNDDGDRSHKRPIDHQLTNEFILDQDKLKEHGVKFPKLDAKTKEIFEWAKSIVPEPDLEEDRVDTGAMAPRNEGIDGSDALELVHQITHDQYHDSDIGDHEVLFLPDTYFSLGPEPEFPAEVEQGQISSTVLRDDLSEQSDDEIAHIISSSAETATIDDQIIDEDPTEELAQDIKDFNMTSTEFKFDLFLTNHQLSRQAWSELQEILTTSPIEEIRSLPKRKEAIVQKMAAQLPLC
uniref:Uncharacterized protein n=1 Tax=Bionectria ochroleuca TaxID=29856 RepID=A0A8H7N7B0_BIOOC